MPLHTLLVSLNCSRAIFPTARKWSMQPAGPKIALCLPCLFVGLWVHTYHVTSYTLLPCDFTFVDQLDDSFEYWCIATTSSSSLASYEFEIPSSRGIIDAMTWGWPRMETAEASSYSWCPTERL